jgi:hypothetical protein
MVLVRRPGAWVAGVVGFCLSNSLAFSQSAVEQRWPATADSFDWALAYAKPAQTPDPFSGLTFKPPATGLPAESGVNYTLSPFGGFLNLGSHSGNQTTGGTSGSVAFPIGQSFGLLTQGTAGSIGGNGIYDVGSVLYWRDPARGLVGGTAQIGHLDSFGGANFASGGANLEGYFARITTFATVGAFGVQSSATRGYGTIGTAIYPTDNLQLALGGYDYGGLSGVRGGVEYLLPKETTTVATTVSVDGFVGNHGTSGAMAKFKFMFGPTPANNKTLIERRRQDDPETPDWNNFFSEEMFDWHKSESGQANTYSSGKTCTDGENVSDGCTCPAPPTAEVLGGQCSFLGPSDIRLKRDIVEIARLDNGIGIYRYRYVWSDQVYVGAMAQEVEKIAPDAVFHGADGYLRVAYARLGLRLQTWEEWTASPESAVANASQSAGTATGSDEQAITAVAAALLTFESERVVTLQQE